MSEYGYHEVSNKLNNYIRKIKETVYDIPFRNYKDYLPDITKTALFKAGYCYDPMSDITLFRELSVGLHIDKDYPRIEIRSQNGILNSFEREENFHNYFIDRRCIFSTKSYWLFYLVWAGKDILNRKSAINNSGIGINFIYKDKDYEMYPGSYIIFDPSEKHAVCSNRIWKGILVNVITKETSDYIQKFIYK